MQTWLDWAHPQPVDAVLLGTSDSNAEHDECRARGARLSATPHLSGRNADGSPNQKGFVHLASLCLPRFFLPVEVRVLKPLAGATLVFRHRPSTLPMALSDLEFEFDASVWRQSLAICNVATSWMAMTAMDPRPAGRATTHLYCACRPAATAFCEALRLGMLPGTHNCSPLSVSRNRFFIKPGMFLLRLIGNHRRGPDRPPLL